MLVFINVWIFLKNLDPSLNLYDKSLLTKGLKMYILLICCWLCFVVIVEAFCIHIYKDYLTVVLL